MSLGDPGFVTETAKTLEAFKARVKEIKAWGYSIAYSDTKPAYRDVILKRGESRILLTWKR